MSSWDLVFKKISLVAACIKVERRHSLFKQYNCSIITLNSWSMILETPEYTFSSHTMNFLHHYGQMSKSDKLKIA